MLRPRFSLRVVLIVFAAAAATLYAMVVRPTHLARRFGAALEGGDVAAAGELLTEGNLDWVFYGDATQKILSADRVYIELAPREYADLLKGRRRFRVCVAHHQDEHGRRLDWTSDTDAVARANGIEIIAPQFVW